MDLALRLRVTFTTKDEERYKLKRYALLLLCSFGEDEIRGYYVGASVRRRGRNKNSSFDILQISFSQKRIIFPPQKQIH